MPKRPSHDDIREKVLTAARAVIDAKGHGALNARLLAAEAGCSVGTLYNVFDDLDGVLHAANRQTARAMHRALGMALEGAGLSPRERLFALAGAYLDFALAHPYRWEALFHLRPRADGSEGQEGEALLALLRDGTGGAMPDDMLIALWAAVHGVVGMATRRHPISCAPGSERRILHLILTAAMEGVDVGNRPA